MSELTPQWIAGAPVHGETILEVRHPYDGHPVARTTYATEEQVEQAVAAADAVRREAAALPIYERADALAAVSRAIADRSE
ncbi:MAG: aldehyde dehydrogenase family protein, partial [Dactylosporangium sp.]|nr:aldehyde dehydrogenase family protein [Dactylosporangium sp.]